MQTLVNEANLTPKKIVQELNRFIIGQDEAKKAVALSLRNRYRRKMVDQPLRDEIVPKNILMVGPTGVGKTEIARRLAKLAGAPFIKVEATKFTEVGYVGRDVESIIRDLVEIAITKLKTEEKNLVQEKAYNLAIERVLDSLIGLNSSEETRDKFKQKLLNKELDDKEVEIEVIDSPTSHSGIFDIPGMPGAGVGVLNIGEMISKTIGGPEKKKKKKMLVAEALETIIEEEEDKLIDEEKIINEALTLVENDGIVFLDEIDKIASRNNAKGGEVSREGVQRDLLPLIEGSTVTTKYGMIQTDHILFIASGAFHLAKPSDLLPELQGRLPIRVELKSLSKDDMIRILTEPESSLIKQYTALLATEGVEISFTDDAIEKIAAVATEINNEIENIGARRLHTIMEKLLEDISFNASELDDKKIIINQQIVDAQISSLLKSTDLSKFIL